MMTVASLKRTTLLQPCPMSENNAVYSVRGIQPLLPPLLLNWLGYLDLLDLRLSL